MIRHKALEAFMNHPKHYEANTIFESYLAAQGFMVLTHKIELNENNQ
jgi:hypothetical protein